MNNNPSPLRYPGGKASFYPRIREILKINNLLGSTYIEPFAGGAGLALRLLISDDVSRIVINDIDFHIYAFWYSVLYYTDELCRLILTTKIDVVNHSRLKAIYNNGEQGDLLQSGFATFFLNRTNVSGVLNGGIIGGKNQNGPYKIDARFNKEELINRIRTIASYREKIMLFNVDGFNVLSLPGVKHLHPSFVNFDPPYVGKGARLYRNSFNTNDHLELARKILSCHRKWIVTYDVDPLILKAYSKRRIGYLDVTYSVKKCQTAKEYIIFSNGLEIPETIETLTTNDSSL